MAANDPKVVGQTSGKRSRLSLESWPLRWKVAATLVVPVLLAATFGAVRIRDELAAASQLNVAAANTTIVAPAVDFVDRLDELAEAAATGTPVADAIARFDDSERALSGLIGSTDFDSSVTTGLASASATARTVRDEIAAGAPASVLLAERADSVASDVASAIATSTASVDDKAVRPLAERLNTVLVAQRALATQQILVAAPDFATSVELRTRAAEAAGAEAAAVERLNRLTPSGDAVPLRGESDTRRTAYTLPLGEAVLTPDLTGSMQASADLYRTLGTRLAADLDDTVQTRATALRSATLRDTAIILGAVLAALFLSLGVGRSLIRSIGRLRRGALQVAQVRLPEEIEQLSKGGAVPEIEALPVTTDEEVGQLARAIDDIHLQAVRLAEEYGVRVRIGDMFETLSRRSRSLVEEQLVLIETLEHDEDDPARLDHLFRLDHLATRMRRNGDNLLVLADTVERHRRMPAVPISEMLRAASSEVEDYRRVTLGPGVDGAIVGAAAADIGHLLAELLDNALQYSPPDSQVWAMVARAADERSREERTSADERSREEPTNADGGVLIEIADEGLGMPDEDIRAANDRLALGGEVTSDTAKRMGLFVVGRLARRHGATVALRANTSIPGVTASVHLPGALLDFGAEPVAPAPVPAERTSTWDTRPPLTVAPPPAPPVPIPASTNGGLPTRSPGASGVNGVPVATTPPPPPPPSAPPAPPREPAWPKPEFEDGSIYARMTSEWMNAPPPPPVAPPPAPKEPNAPMQRHTPSGLPIRERGARLMPDHVDGASDITESRKDPEAIRNVLSRQLTGVRRARAETDADDSRGEGDR